MRCGNCNREFDDGIAMCPYCGYDNGNSKEFKQEKRRKQQKKSNIDKNNKNLVQGVILIAALAVIVAAGINIFSTLQKAAGNNIANGGQQGAAVNANQQGVVSAGQQNGEFDNNSSAEETAEPVQSSYSIIKGDYSWREAAAECQIRGGHLAVITSQEEYDIICELADTSGLTYIWIGGSLENCSRWGDSNCWVTGEDWTFEAWYPGEPTYKDSSDGAEESYLCIWNAKVDGKYVGWLMNDQREDLGTVFANLDDKVGFICELDDKTDNNIYTGESAYNEGDFIIPDSNSRYITTSELDSLSAEELKIARNEIFARHGRKFQTESLQAYFNSKSWYNATIEADDFSESMLNAYEKKNAKMILEYEKSKGYR